ncbi:hypothetical protein [Neochlamydia sp. AcF84]|uniref:hypothetical protein n=1 Tax=Neochlamydia sp. AcF84 TaxID=2315858 RepID=UPI00140D8BBD|nr:hypothetical protein [Neochlamydia sp. AcF84]
MQNNPFTDGKEILISRLYHFKFARDNIDEELNPLKQPHFTPEVKKISLARVIMIGETHESKANEISELVRSIVEYHFNHGGTTLFLLSESEARCSDWSLAKLGEQVKIACWDQDPSTKALDIFFGKAVWPANLYISDTLINYLKNPCLENLLEFHKNLAAVQALIEKTFEKPIIQKFFSKEFINTSLNKLSYNLKGYEFITNIKKAYASHEIQLVLACKNFINELNLLALEMTLKVNKHRNTTMIKIIKEGLNTYDKVIVIAGRLHFSTRESPHLEQNIYIKESIQIIREELSPANPFEERYPYVIIEASLPEDDLPLPIPLSDAFPLPAEKHHSRQRKEKKKCKEESEHDKIKTNANKFKTVDTLSLSDQFINKQSQILTHAQATGKLHNTDIAMLANLMIETLEQLMDLKKTQVENK